LTAAAAAVMAAAGYRAAGGGKVSMGWVLAAYLPLTAGEVLVYGTGLDLSYAFAPPSMKGLVTACFLLTSAAGNLIHTRLAPLYEHPLPADRFFLLDTGIGLLAAAAFYWVGRRFTAAHGGGRLATQRA